MLIVFSGTDGAGKSTQIDLLKLFLEERGFSTKYLWSRGGYTPGFNFLKRVIRIFSKSKLPQSGESTQRKDLLKKKSVSKLWLSIAIIDLIVFYAIYVRFISWTGRVVICDRYLEDTLLDFQRNFGSSFDSNSILWKCLEFSAPKSDSAFLLTVPVEVSVYRSKLKNEPFPDSEETLEWRLACYNNESVFPACTFKKIDCQSSVLHIQEEIQKYLIEKNCRYF